MILYEMNYKSSFIYLLIELESRRQEEKEEKRILAFTEY